MVHDTSLIVRICLHPLYSIIPPEKILAWLKQGEVVNIPSLRVGLLPKLGD